MAMDESNKVPEASVSQVPAGASATPSSGDRGAAVQGLLTASYLADKLADAELLLGYAAETGREVDLKAGAAVLEARLAWNQGGLTPPAANALMSALTGLAADLKPVSAESLRFCVGNKDKKLNGLATIAIIAGLVIIIFSVLTFVSKDISEKITTNIDAANTLVSKLRAELGPSDPSVTNFIAESPDDAIAWHDSRISWQDWVWFGTNGVPAGLSEKDVLTDLQQFAVDMRAINGYSRQLQRCLLDFSGHRYSANATNLELTPGLNVRLAVELTDKASEYQQVRSLGTQLVERVNVYYGAAASCVLPVWYALLGTLAYLLRLYDVQLKARTRAPGDKYIARLLIAGIGGLVIGQFNDLSQGFSISPFAVAFLVGYAVDAFFTFLDGMLHIFNRGSSPS